jgi:hypothetical protein
MTEGDVTPEWVRYMRAGDFTAAWHTSDTARQRQHNFSTSLPRHLQSVWDGRPVDGQHVLVRCYHGLGDTIQFARYLPLLSTRVRELTVWAQPTLIPLLASADVTARLLPLHDGTPETPYDVDVEIMELPYVFRTTVDTIPAATPYLGASPCVVDRSKGPAVGVVWRGGNWGPHRSVPFALLLPLFGAPVTWHVLQDDAGSRECPQTLGVRPDTSTISRLASVIAGLDLVISVDSMPAHLAGALGKPIWTLLPADADWRWMLDRDDSPWYPTMRLFRQSEPGDWAPVIRRVAASLDQWLLDFQCQRSHAAGDPAATLASSG